MLRLHRVLRDRLLPGCQALPHHAAPGFLVGVREAKLLREGRFYPDLLRRWLRYGMTQGLISPEVAAALGWVERGS